MYKFFHFNSTTLFQISVPFYVIFHKETYNADEVKELHFELVNDAFANPELK